MAAVRRVFQIAARRFDLTDSSVQMNGAAGAGWGWVVDELPPASRAPSPQGRRGVHKDRPPRAAPSSEPGRRAMCLHPAGSRL